MVGVERIGPVHDRNFVEAIMTNDIITLIFVALVIAGIGIAKNVRVR